MKPDWVVSQKCHHSLTKCITVNSNQLLWWHFGLSSKTISFSQKCLEPLVIKE